jgi:hypothetical protein
MSSRFPTLAEINLRKENRIVPRRSKSNANAEDAATETAIVALGFIAADSERLQRFLALSGLGPQNLRQAAAEPAFLRAVLEYIVGDEKLLVDFSRERGASTEDIVRAGAILAGPPVEEF